MHVKDTVHRISSGVHKREKAEGMWSLSYAFAANNRSEDSQALLTFRVITHNSRAEASCLPTIRQITEAEVNDLSLSRKLAGYAKEILFGDLSDSSPPHIHPPHWENNEWTNDHRTGHVAPSYGSYQCFDWKLLAVFSEMNRINLSPVKISWRNYGKWSCQTLDFSFNRLGWSRNGYGKWLMHSTQRWKKSRTRSLVDDNRFQSVCKCPNFFASKRLWNGWSNSTLPEKEA